MLMTSALPGVSAATRQPVLFLGHGSPMNAITDTPQRRAWVALGRQFGSRWPRPQRILAVSAHWVTQGTWLTGMAQPRTIHDFAGFPPELSAQRYPAPGDPAWARELAQALGAQIGQSVGVDTQQWGLDHGTWAVLASVFAQADIPVVQLSLDRAAGAQQFLALGRALRPLRDQGVLVLASGNVVHNLGLVRWDAPLGWAYDWASAFDARVAEVLTRGDLEALADWPQWGRMSQQAHPSADHLWPLLVAAGAAEVSEAPWFFNATHQLGSIAMRSVVWTQAPDAMEEINP